MIKHTSQTIHQIFHHLFAIILFIISCSLGATHIENFDSHITITPTGKLEITTTITYVETARGKHGIVHWLPVVYNGPLGTNYTTALSISSITRNDLPVEYTTTQKKGRIVIRIGSNNTTIQPGKYTYQITYSTDRQIQFYDNYDELAWNVTGTESSIPIKSARATISLPKTIPTKSITTSAFTGYYQSREMYVSIAKSSPHTITYTTTQTLAPYEGLTIYISWQKGYITKPTTFDTIWLFAQDNPGLILFIFLFSILIALLIHAIKTIRRAENSTTIIPRFYPPEKMTPAECGYLKKQRIEAEHTAAEIVDLAIRGYLTIQAEPDSKEPDRYALQKTKKSWGSLKSPIEIALLTKLFEKSEKRYFQKKPTQKEQEDARLISKQVEKTLQASPVKEMLTLHIRHVLPVLLASLISLILTSLLDGYVSPLAIIPTVIVMGIAIIFIPGYTANGRAKRDELDGFILYLKAAELDRFAIIGTPPTRTPELFEKYLPYAMALNLEKQWNKQFAPLFKELESTNRPYQPHWFIGRYYSPYLLRQFARTYAMSAYPQPTYSSSKVSTGRFGGGFSGGGRGGGGTGSW